VLDQDPPARRRPWPADHGRFDRRRAPRADRVGGRPGPGGESPLRAGPAPHGAPPLCGRGRPRLRPRRVAGDKGYSSPTARRRLRQRRISPVIPSKSTRAARPHFDRAAYRLRNRVERLINRLKQFRRIATRYEKRAANYLAMLTIGRILLWINAFAATPSAPPQL